MAVPAVTVVANVAPIAMKAPARTPRASVFAAVRSALASPTSSALRAMRSGGSASRPRGVKTWSPISLAPGEERSPVRIHLCLDLGDELAVLRPRQVGEPSLHPEPLDDGPVALRTICQSIAPVDAANGVAPERWIPVFMYASLS